MTKNFAKSIKAKLLNISQKRKIGLSGIGHPLSI